MKNLRTAVTLVASVSLSGCSPEQNIRFHTYKLGLVFVQNGEARQFSVVNKVRVADKYNYAPGMAGMARTCKANATAITVPVKQGSIIALLDSQAGSAPSWNPCQIGELALTKPIGQWQMPRLVFVASHESIENAISLDCKDLERYRITIASISATETDEDVTPIPNQFMMWGCTGKLQKNTSTDRLPSCSSLVVREIT